MNDDTTTLLRAARMLRTYQLVTYIAILPYVVYNARVQHAGHREYIRIVIIVYTDGLK